MNARAIYLHSVTFTMLNLTSLVRTVEQPKAVMQLAARAKYELIIALCFMCPRSKEELKPGQYTQRNNVPVNEEENGLSLNVV